MAERERHIQAPDDASATSDTDDAGDADALEVLDALDALEREVAASPLMPGGLIALNAYRVTGLTMRLRAADAAARSHPLAESARAARLRQAEAEAALIEEEARRQSELLLSGKRVDGLREAEVERILGEARERGAALVNAAYDYAATRIGEVRERAGLALEQVRAARDAVREEEPGPAQRLAAAVGTRAGGAVARLFARLFRA